MKRHIPTVLILLFLNFVHSQVKPGIVLVKSDTIIPIDSIIRHSPLEKQIKFDGSDGPHIVNDTLYRVNKYNEFIVENEFNTDSIVVDVNNAAADKFTLTLQSDYQTPKSTYELPDKMAVIADIEGKFDAFSSFLISNKIIDENHNWIFDNGHLVLVGDFVDRGKNVTQILWLIYKMEFQAVAHSGQVHFILGNHEVLNFQGDHRYNSGKYIKIAQEISGIADKKKAIKYMYSDRSELGKWLATKNVIEKIGDYLFVHAGLSPEILDYDLTLDNINEIVRLGFKKEISLKDHTRRFLYSSKGPFWYRGLVRNRPNYTKITSQELQDILTYYKSKKIVIGHTLVKDVTSGFDGKVIMLDVPHGTHKYSGKTKGLLIENEMQFIVSDSGEKIVLE